ncbi:cytidylate kinase-like family protein [Geobacter sp. FeAm09]|uniref:cytidylate kinase-like family protein n=1 Tax=Geobacter sp. FeAm09 TaxID=2597769 RepID=UPI0011EC060E|nr:cytidylate kinase-like family protein [Geobacter sp. FeAm09]QEM66700.1 cytidylate kinase-like family protein [Geobacter sp. FeAm09]QEM70056.1 cytidylate kinase-like family protein [Geobacter sp. FeAm09]
MPEKLLIPSVEMRLGSLLEFNRKRDMEASSPAKHKKRQTITISREFGCEAYPMAERLREIMEKKHGEPWVLLDKGLLDEVAQDHHLSANVLNSLGEKSRFLDEILATFSSRWKSEKDHFRVLCRHVLSLAEQGNVIIVGRGSSIVTQPLKNCFHFRLFASPGFKVRSIAHRMGVEAEEAEKIIAKQQKQRDNFIRDFLDRDARDLGFYHLVLNNDKNSVDTMARTIAEYVTAL